MASLDQRVAELERTEAAGQSLVFLSWMLTGDGLLHTEHGGRHYVQQPDESREDWMDRVRTDIKARSPGHQFIWVDEIDAAL